MVWKVSNIKKGHREKSCSCFHPTHYYLRGSLFISFLSVLSEFSFVREAHIIFSCSIFHFKANSGVTYTLLDTLLSPLILVSFHIRAKRAASFFFAAAKHPTLWSHTSLFNQFSVAGYLGGFFLVCYKQCWHELLQCTVFSWTYQRDKSSYAIELLGQKDNALDRHWDDFFE